MTNWQKNVITLGLRVLVKAVISFFQQYKESRENKK